jgi:hypothetical protein
MFASLGYDEELTAQKAFLVARCEAERRQAGECFAAVEARLGWWELAWQAVKTVAPYTRVALPLTGVLAAKLLFRRRRADPVPSTVPAAASVGGGKLALVWKVVQWMLPLVRQYLAARRRA